MKTRLAAAFLAFSSTGFISARTSAADLAISGHFCTCRAYDDVSVICSDDRGIEIQTPLSPEGDFALVMPDFDPSGALNCRAVDHERGDESTEFRFVDAEGTADRYYRLRRSDASALTMLGVNWRPGESTVQAEIRKIFED